MKEYVKALFYLLYNEEDTNMFKEAMDKKLFRLGETPEKSEFVLCRKHDSSRILPLVPHSHDKEIIIISFEFAQECKREFEKRFSDSEPVQIMQVIE